MDDNKVHIGIDNKANAWWRWFTKRIVWIPLTVTVVLVAGIIVFCFVYGANNQNDTYAKQQKSLQSSLQQAMDNDNPQGIVDVVTRLLDGQASGIFTVTNPQLSTLYLDRASAYLNLGQFKNAVSDYNQAISLDGSNKLAALQGEVEARYKMGDRQQLIPLYQNMIDLETKSGNPMHNSEVAQYTDNIQALQLGQEIQFQ
jgi:tetratricopeptide (TPR) repeat protein